MPEEVKEMLEIDIMDIIDPDQTIEGTKNNSRKIEDVPESAKWHMHHKPYGL